MGDSRQQAESEVQEAPPPKSEKGKEAAPEAAAPEASGEDPGCLVKTDCPAPCPELPDPKDDDPGISKPISKQIEKLNVDIALGDALKPIMAERLAFQQGEATIRKDIFDAYQKALNDGVSRDYEKADEQFKDIAAELNRAVDGKPPPLAAWIEKWLGEAGEVGKVFDVQRRLERRLLGHSGPRECAFRQAQDTASRCKQAHEDWKAPGAKIKAIIDSYKGQLPKLACDVHARDPYAIYQFWFEVAPKHLSVRADPVRTSNAAGIDRICGALAAYPARRRGLTSAAERGEGGLYLIDLKNQKDLDAHREKILEAWDAAVRAQVEAEVRYKLWPDDAATLAAALAKQVASEANDIKKLLQPA